MPQQVLEDLCDVGAVDGTGEGCSGVCTRRDTPRSWAAGRITSAARSTVPLMFSRMGSNLSLFDFSQLPHAYAPYSRYFSACSKNSGR